MTNSILSVAVRRLVMVMLVVAASPVVADQAEARQGVRDANLRRLEAIVAKDADKLQALYADDAVFMVPNAPPVAGAEAIGDTWRDLMALDSFRMTHSIVRLEVGEGGDLAMDLGSYTFGFKADAGEVNDSGKYLLVWKQVDGNWRITADMFNSNGPDN